MSCLSADTTTFHLRQGATINNQENLPFVAKHRNTAFEPLRLQFTNAWELPNLYDRPRARQSHDVHPLLSLAEAQYRLEQEQIAATEDFSHVEYKR